MTGMCQITKFCRRAVKKINAFSSVIAVVGMEATLISPLHEAEVYILEVYCSQNFIL